MEGEGAREGGREREGEGGKEGGRGRERGKGGRERGGGESDREGRECDLMTSIQHEGMSTKKSRRENKGLLKNQCTKMVLIYVCTV